ncbi:cytochrome P450 [Thozetella sp. PMI_491]|nr:cytochrome P450 [Thozetella sp. PMI_491]
MGILLDAFTRVLTLVLLSFAALPFVILVNLLWRFTSDAGLPKSLPWAGVDAGGGRYHRLKANMRSLFDTKSMINEGYAKYSKEDKTYILPHFLTGPEVVLPLCQTRWLIEQPDTVLSQTEVNRQFLEADHTFLHPNIVREPVHPEVIKRELTHKLSSFADDIVDELELCLTENWGADTENWREVKVYDTLLDVISRLSTRVLVGTPLCRNKKFVRSAGLFDKNVVLSAAALNLLPNFLKPLFSPVLTFYDHLQYATLSEFVLPLIDERLEQLGYKEERLPLHDQRKPNDYFQWAIDHALTHWDSLELTSRVIACRLACLCFAAIQSSIISITNTLFDIASSPNCADYMNMLREEDITTATARRLGHGSSPWGKATLARMTRVDSALRESMRLNGFVARGVMKMVTAREGVTLPDGSHIPYGTKVGIQAYSIHRDKDYYPDPEKYHAFRFAENSGENTKAPRPLRRGQERTHEPRALVTTSPTFLAFSHGPNACPGRFFAANQLKLTLAHIALHYEIEPIAQRPANRWFVGSMAPHPCEKP